MNKFLKVAAMALALVGSGCMATQPAHAETLYPPLCTQAQVDSAMADIGGERYFRIEQSDISVFQNWILSKGVQYDNTFSWSQVDFMGSPEHDETLVLVYTPDFVPNHDCAYFFGFLNENDVNEVMNLVRGT